LKQQRGGGYRLLIDQENAQKFLEEVKKIHNHMGTKQKETINIDNTFDYPRALKYLDEALEILKNDVSDEKMELIRIKNKFEKHLNSNQFYKFDKDSDINCTVVINDDESAGSQILGKLIAVDDNMMAVVMTDRGTYVVTVDKNIQSTDESNPKLAPVSGQKQIFTADRRTTRKTPISTDSNQTSTLQTETENETESVTESSDRANEMSREYASGSREYTSVSSPYLATSEYLSIAQSDASSASSDNNSGSNSSNSERSDLSGGARSKSSSTSSSSDRSSSSSQSDRSSSSSQSDRSSQSSQSDRSSTSSSSDRSSEKNKVVKKTNIKGGVRNQLSGGVRNKLSGGARSNSSDAKNKNGIKYMKAGVADNVGIEESSKDKYYSESTSIEEGLCE